MLVIVLLVLAGISAGSELWTLRVIRRHDRPQPGLPTGAELIRRVTERHDLGHVPVEDGDVDAYIGLQRTVQLAGGRRDRGSVSAVALAAHEAGHLLQHATGARSWQVWWVLASPAYFAGLLLVPIAVAQALVGGAALLVAAGVLLAVIATAAAASLVTEVDASRRAAAELDAEGITGEVRAQAGRVLRLAALTYVTATIYDVAALARRVGPQGDEDVPTDEPGVADGG